MRTLVDPCWETIALGLLTVSCPRAWPPPSLVLADFASRVRPTLAAPLRPHLINFRACVLAPARQAVAYRHPVRKNGSSSSRKEVTLAEATTTDAGCGCCQPEAKTKQDMIRELEARRDELDERLRRLDVSGRDLVGAR